MKIGFYSPYLDALGGGERYVLTLASHWCRNHRVTLFWDDPQIRGKAEQRFNINLSKVKTAENVFRTKNIFKKMFISRQYDAIFFLTDGSIPTSFAKYNILHFQVPFQHIPVHPIKLTRFQAIVCNSDFTRRNIDSRLGRHACVIYPPITPIKHTNIAKKNVILSVGRFHPLKKQDVLIEAFRIGVKGTLSNYTLILAGGLLEPDKPYLKRLQTAAKNLPVQILPNVTYRTLTGLYRDASVYWHAAGIHESNPEHMEHFGISTAEAMSAGAVPVVYSGGGLPEIVRPEEDGFLWANTDDLLKYTARVIASKTLRASLAKAATIRAGEFSTNKFTGSFDKLLAGISR